MVRSFSFLAATLALGLALAQQPVASPIYYLSTAPLLEPDVPVHGELTRAHGRNFKDGSYLDVLVLHGTGGERVELRAASTWFDTFLSLYAPDGSLLDWNDDDWQAGGTDSLIRTTLPTTGTYVVVVSGYGADDIGPYTVTLRGGGADSEAAVEVPALVAGDLDAGARASYRLTLEEQVVVSIELRSFAFDTYLEVFDGDGWLVAENDDLLLGSTDSGLILRLEPGTYEVVVSSYGSGGGGAFELELARFERVP